MMLMFVFLTGFEPASSKLKVSCSMPIKLQEYILVSQARFERATLSPQTIASDQTELLREMFMFLWIWVDLNHRRPVKNRLIYSQVQLPLCDRSKVWVLYCIININMLSTRPQNKSFGIRAKLVNHARKIQNQITYLNNPNYCGYCNTPLVYRNHGKFCDHSCASSYTNKQRKPMPQHTKDKIAEAVATTLYKKHSETKILASTRKLSKVQFSECEMCHDAFYVKHHKNIRTNRCTNCKVAIFSKVRTNKCNVCNVVFLKSRYQKYCDDCSPNIRHYRTRAAFKFNVYDYPDKFDLSLIYTHGWYSPNGYNSSNKTPNLSGVSRDHKYSILDGFNNNINPKLLAHPANCDILIHNGVCGNNEKNSASSITIEQLKVLIVEWDNETSVPN